MCRRLQVLVWLVMAATVLSACGGGGSGATHEVTVHATELAFQPNEIKVNKGDQVKLTLINDGKLVHDLTISELKVEIKAEVGQTKVHTFTASKAGTLQFVCAQPGHKEGGMAGKLIVQ